MSKISKEEIKNIATMTKLSIKENDMAGIQKQFVEMLAYAERVQEVAKDIDIPSNKNINHDREDSAVVSDAADILAQAPQEEDNYFVVPKIVDSE